MNTNTNPFPFTMQARNLMAVSRHATLDQAIAAGRALGRFAFDVSDPSGAIVWVWDR